MFKRIFLFLAANIAIIAVISTILSIFNVQPYLTPYGLDYQSLLIYSAIVGFAGSFVSLFISKWMAKHAYGIEILTTPRTSEERFLVETIRGLAQKAGIGVPEIGIYESPEPNAFATGWNRNNALVATSTGLLEAMTHEEVEGVLGHEIAHIANGDMVTMTLLQGVVNTFVIFFARIAAYAVQAFLNRGRDNENIGGIAYYLTSIVFEIFFGILASTLVMWFSRHREFRADAGSAQFFGSPTKMISALEKLQRLQNRPVDERGKQFATMKISDRPSHFAAIFSSHPPLEKRIEALKKGF